MSHDVDHPKIYRNFLIEVAKMRPPSIKYFGGPSEKSCKKSANSGNV